MVSGRRGTISLRTDDQSVEPQQPEVRRRAGRGTVASRRFRLAMSAAGVSFCTQRFTRLQLRRLLNLGHVFAGRHPTRHGCGLVQPAVRLHDPSRQRQLLVRTHTTAPAVTVTAPNGGQAWAARSVHAITWTATDDVGVTAADLYYSTDGGLTFTAIAAGVANTGSCNWTVPNVATTSALVKVVAHDGNGNTGQDLSDAPFTITAQAGSPTDIYVWDMAWSVTQKGGAYTVSVTLFVKRDSDGDGVAEASDAAASGVVTNFVLDHFLSGLC